ncbi:peroxin [Apophysomyces ossiformis]|uniref:Peroxin n=1 Tax=Apophysomyces ossiformis TaxID=679940 RepID=A0A8H7BJW0_9FUNG|nr:peroxin [Apophysomyces ossiformis]
MTLFTSLKDYAKRHRKGLLVSATIAGGGYLAARYAAGKIRDIQERATSERLAKENLKRRFQQNQNDCVFTVISLLPTLGDQLLYEVNVEGSWAKLQESRKLEKLEEKKQRQKEAETDAADQQSQKAENSTEEPLSGTIRAGGDIGAATDSEAENKKENSPSAGEGKSTLPLDTSVGSLSISVHSDDSNGSSASSGILSKEAKYLLWEEIKTMSFTRTLTSIYCVTLLTLLTHVQLNLLGRFTYVWSVAVLNRSEPTIRLQHADDQPDAGFLDPATERMFLSTTWWLLHRGWRQCFDRVRAMVDDIVGSIPLKNAISYKEAQHLIYSLRQRIEYEEDGLIPFSFRSWMLPESHDDEVSCLKEAGFADIHLTDDNATTVTLRKLLDETKDFIDSPDFAAVLASCLDEVFSIFDQRVFAKSLLPDSISSESMSTRIREISAEEARRMEKKLTLANLLPSVSRQAHLVIAGNEYLNAFAYIKELQTFSAMVYTQYGDELESA